ncbi:MAG: hypothetical protein IJV86_00485 [Clostridia bacterium]|nr:hypothetical protein [Clostridia bacterium]
MKKSVKIILAVLTVFLIAVGVFTYKQWNTITAVVDSFRYTQEDVDKKVEEQKEAVQTFINETEGVSVRELTEEEEKSLREGKLTESEIVEILTEPNSNSKDVVSSGNGGEKPSSENEQGKLVSEAIAKLYIQKSVYLGKLDSIEAQVRSEYKNMSAEEKKTAKTTLAAKYMSQISAWEKECDTIVYGIIDEIKAALEKEGKDLAIVTELKETYLSEKRAKKAYFINKYKN